MRILIINSEYPPIGGGAGNASANIAHSMVAKGQDVAVLTAHFSGLPREETQDGIYIRRIWALRRHISRSSPVEQIIFFLSGLINILPLVRTWRPDIVLAFFGIPSGAIAWVLKCFCGLEYVVSLRGGDVPGFRPYDFARYHRMTAPFIRWIWRKSAAVVANSNGLQTLANKFEPDLPIQVIPNGINLEKFQSVDRDWSTPHLLFVGRLVYQKGLDLLMDALRALKDIPWKLSVIGDGPHSQAIQTLVDESGLTDRVEFLGWQSRDSLPEIYQQSSLFVFPSRHEGMPNAVLEAMACGLPVIASRIAGNEELVDNDTTGLLVAPEDIPALRESIRELILDANRCRKMGQQGRLRVEAAYSWERAAQRYLELIQQILEKS